MYGFKKGAARGRAQCFAEGGFVPASKRGGPVRGPGTGTSDSISTEVPDGSYILPADSTAQIGEQNIAAMGFKPNSVPVNLSNGEYALPPEQVHAIGKQVLDRMKDATHTPVPEQGAQRQAKGFRPGLFFVNGELVDQKKQAPAGAVPDAAAPAPAAPDAKPLAEPAAPNTPPPTAPAAPASVPPSAPSPAPSAPLPPPTRNLSRYGGANVLGDAPPASSPSAGALPAGLQSGYGAPGYQKPDVSAPAPTPSSPSAAPSAPQSAAAPSGSPIPGVTDFGKGSRLEMVMNGANEEIKDNKNKRQYAQGMGSFVRGGVTAVPAAITDVGEAALSPVANFGKGLLGIGDADAAPSASQSPAMTPASKTGPGSKTEPAPADATKPTAPTNTETPSADKPAAGDAPPTANNVTKDGNSYSGTNISGENFTINNKALGGGSAKISKQNMDAADALASRYETAGQIAAARGAAGFVPEGASGPRVGVIEDPRQRDRIRSTLIREASNPYAGSQNGRLTASQRANLQGLLSGDQHDATARYTADQNASIAQTREAGENARAAMREHGANARTAGMDNIQSRRLALDEQAQGFKIRAGERQEALHQKYAAAKTQEERSAIAQQIQDLSGNSSRGGWRGMQISGGTDKEGVKSPDSLALWNEATGEVRMPPGAQQAASTRPVGTRSTVNGKTAEWDGKQWNPL